MIYSWYIVLEYKYIYILYILLEYYNILCFSTPHNGIQLLIGNLMSRTIYSDSKIFFSI